jgi:hypothetical protein
MARTDKSSSPALAYLRTSSAANVGADKDSDRRQRQTIRGFAKRAGFGIVDEFYDAAVSSALPAPCRSLVGASVAANKAPDFEAGTIFPDERSEHVAGTARCPSARVAGLGMRRV